MSEIKKLIERLCPEGVEYKTLGVLCEIKTGKGITQNDCTEDGLYPVMSGGQAPMGFYNEYNREGNTVTVSRVGAYAGFVSYLAEKFYCNDKCFSVIPKNNISINTKFLFYVLKHKEGFIKGLQSEGGVPTINTKKVGSVEIPVPPIEVQSKIVEILDNFTELEAQLKSELEARRKQYEYYRNQLLTFDKVGGARFDVKWMKMGEICNILDSMRKPITKGKRIEGSYPYYGASGIVDYVEDYIFDGDYLLISEDGANLEMRTMPIAFSITGKNWVNNHAHVLQFENINTQKYVQQYIEYMDISIYLSKGSMPKLTQAQLKSILIPIPPLSEQKRIVSILDRFEALTTDLQSGLPAEIAARRQQYEYYREKLLTFKRKIA